MVSTDPAPSGGPGEACGEGVGGEPGVGSVTLLERMTGAGIGEDRARGHIERGVVRVAGEPVTDPRTPLPWPRAWVGGPE